MKLPRWFRFFFHVEVVPTAAGAKVTCYPRVWTPTWFSKEVIRKLMVNPSVTALRVEGTMPYGAQETITHPRNNQPKEK